MSPSLPSWIKASEAQQLTVRLIQCDLARHSTWFYKCVAGGYGGQATAAKETLAENIRRALNPYKFDLVSWRGDGGVYAAREGDATGATVIKAARAIRKVFLQWQQGYVPELKLGDLAFRISCHSCPVWIGPDPQYWSSDGLNLFCKHERDLAHENTITITHEVFMVAGEFASDFALFGLPVTVGESPPQDWERYVDTTISLKEALSATKTSFREAFGGEYCQDVAAGSQRFAIGDSMVLQMVASPEDTLDIDLKGLPAKGFGVLETLPRWRKLEDELKREIERADDPRKRVDWEKAAPMHLRFPLTDFPVAMIEYQPVLYSKARSFFTLIKEDQQLFDDLAKGGADYDEKMPYRPGLLVCHMVVLIHDGNGLPCVILSQRSTRQKENVGWAPGKWSASIEEQFTTSDKTLKETVRRGLREELGEVFHKATFTFAALFLERNILNLAVATICRTGLSFGEVHGMWRDCEEDKTEHSQIVALPLDSNIIKDCITQRCITEAARSRCIVVDQNTWNLTKRWDLHLSSPFRLALALWALRGV